MGQREAQRIQALFVGQLAEREYRAVEPAVVACHFHRHAPLAVVEAGQCIVPFGHRPGRAVDLEQFQRTHQRRIAGHRGLPLRAVVGFPRAQRVGLLEPVGGHEAVEGGGLGGFAVQPLRLAGIAGLLRQPRLEILPARIAALRRRHLADRRQRRRPVATRHRLARAPLVQAFVVGAVGYGVEPARRIRSVRGHRPQRDLVQHLAALRLAQLQRLGELRQLPLGRVRIGLGQFLQAVHHHLATALCLRPGQRAHVHGVQKRRVVVGLGQFGGGQAARGAAHHRRLLRIGRRFHPRPAQRVVHAAARLQHREHRIAGIGQRLAAAAPQRLRLVDPLRIGAAGGLARVELGAAQAGVVGGLPVGQQRRPILAPRQRRQPQCAEALGHRLPGVALEELLRLRIGDAVDIAPQVGVFEPAVQRVLLEGGRLHGIELAALGGVDRRAQRRTLGVQGLGEGRGRAAQRGGEQQDRRAQFHAPDYTERR